ncbi:MAG TPA: hypothetical protein VMU29_12065 [Smithella sp.]|nr:hypothetical protein [Smithella sp.]
MILKKIVSKVTGETLHIILPAGAASKLKRVDIIDPENPLQCAALSLKDGESFKAHYHIPKSQHLNFPAQESWHVVKGKVLATFYDVDNTVLDYVILHKGDTSFTLKGGHNYKCLSKKASVLEFKTGPYKGQENDKVFIP